MAKTHTKGLAIEELAAAFADPEFTKCYPVILNVKQASQLLQIPVATLYDWHCRGLLKGCCRKVGKHLRFPRNRLIQHIFRDLEA